MHQKYISEFGSIDLAQLMLTASTCKVLAPLVDVADDTPPTHAGVLAILVSAETVVLKAVASDGFQAGINGV